jgi:hypothetical protein
VAVADGSPCLGRNGHRLAHGRVHALTADAFAAGAPPGCDVCENEQGSWEKVVLTP